MFCFLYIIYSHVYVNLAALHVPLGAGPEDMHSHKPLGDSGAPPTEGKPRFRIICVAYLQICLETRGNGILNPTSIILSL